MLIPLIWLGLAVVVGFTARSRGHSGIAWFVLAMVISPLLGGLMVIALPRLHEFGNWMLISPTRQLAPPSSRQAMGDSTIEPTFAAQATKIEVSIAGSGPKAYPPAKDVALLSSVKTPAPEASA